MARKNIHPKLHDLKIIMPDGKELITKSTWGKGVLTAEVAFSEHPAWTGEGRGAISKSERIEKANERFAGITAFNLDD